MITRGANIPDELHSLRKTFNSDGSLSADYLLARAGAAKFHPIAFAEGSEKSRILLGYVVFGSKIMEMTHGVDSWFHSSRQGTRTFRCAKHQFRWIVHTSSVYLLSGGGSHRAGSVTN